MESRELPARAPLASGNEGCSGTIYSLRSNQVEAFCLYPARLAAVLGLLLLAAFLTGCGRSLPPEGKEYLDEEMVRLNMPDYLLVSVQKGKHAGHSTADAVYCVVVEDSGENQSGHIILRYGNYWRGSFSDTIDSEYWFKILSCTNHP
jgi:hypothetical protein